MRKSTEQEAREWLKKNKPTIELVKWGGGASEYSIFRCLLDGKVWNAQFSVMRYDNTGCPYCSGRSWKADDIKQWLIKNKKSIKLMMYSGCIGTKSIFKCKRCGWVWSTRFSVMKYKNTGCPHCAGNVKYDKNSINVILEKSDRTVRLLHYRGCTHDKSLFVCMVCGEEFDATANNVLRGSGCPYCYGHMKMTEEGARCSLKNTPYRLVDYGGSAASMSALRCTKCGHIFPTTISRIRYGYGCPCCNANGKHYLYKGIHFHSSWEISYYMYQEVHGIELYRNPQTLGSGVILSYGRGLKKEWHPDFIMKNGRKVEVKPEKGGIDKNFRAKKYADKKHGYHVIWIGWKQVKEMQKWLIKHGYDWEQYRVNDKKDKPKVKKQNKSDECEESCCCGKA